MENSTKVFNNLKVKDKIIVMFSAVNKNEVVDREVLIESSQQFEEKITASVGKTHIKDIFSHIDESTVGGVSDFIYDPLQEVSLCMVRTQDGADIELISGEKVRSFLKK